MTITGKEVPTLEQLQRALASTEYEVVTELLSGTLTINSVPTQGVFTAESISGQTDDILVSIVANKGETLSLSAIPIIVTTIIKEYNESRDRTYFTTSYIVPEGVTIDTGYTYNFFGTWLRKKG